LADPSEDPADKIGAEGSMQYLEQLDVGIDDASMFLALQVLQAENIGELTKEGFVKGWREAGYA
jgi:DCN1-like protein 1/2